MSVLRVIASLLVCAAPVAAEVAASMPGGPTVEDIASFKRDFKDFDSNMDDFLDVQEVRGNFKGDVADSELWEFYKMADNNPMDGLVSMNEYIDYAAKLSAQGPTDGAKEELA